MDITAQQLRDVHPPEAFRGYHRDEVDALLDRAAVRIEQLERENRALKAGRPNGAAVAAGVSDVDAGVIQRALIQAQKTADQAVAEAEAKAQALVDEAEKHARHIADIEKGKLESDIEALTTKREALTRDVSRLEEFTDDYRARIQRAIDGEVERLHTSALVVAPPGTRPALATARSG